MPQFIYVCVHCEERIGSGKYCRYCSTKEKRDEMDKENKKIGEELKKKYGKK